jgi:predicted ATPase
LVGAGGPLWVTRLLEATRGLTVLITSRVALGIGGECAYPVPPLSKSASIDLFLDRARAAQPGFTISDQVPELCDRLDRIPLAIELCASWASVLTSGRMGEALSRRFELMQSRKRDVPERQQSLRTVLEWTCPEEPEIRTSFSMLSVMRGSWSLEAAEAVIGDRASEVLDRLLDRALLSRSPDEEQARFSLLETVREFAQELLTEEEARTAHQRHNRYFCRLAYALGNEHLHNSRRGFERLDLEHANIHAAFQFGVGCAGDLLEATISAIEFLRWIWWVRGYEPQFRHLVSQIAAHDESGLTGDLKAKVLRFKARQAGYEQRFSDAIGHLEAAHELWLELGDRGSASEALKAISSNEVALGNPQTAVDRLHAALALVPEGSEGHYILKADLAALLLREVGNVDEAERLYRELLAHWSQHPSKRGHRAVLSAALAECAMRRGDPASAEGLLRKAIDFFDESGELVKAVDAWDHLAECLQARGRPQEAAQARSEAESRRRAARR